MRLLSSIAAVAAVAAATCTAMAKDCHYSSSGPCVPTEVLDACYQSQVDPGKNAKLSLTVTIPGRCQSIQGPYPVILYLNGFQARSGFYRAYAERMASWGYLVVQYNLPLFWIIPDANEVRYLDGILEWLDQQNRDEDSALHGIVDMTRIGTAGHSRGAKLACLHFAGNGRIKAAYLVDPVDNTKRTPEGEDYPSGVKALKQLGKPVGISGAGIVGRCNPEGSNYQDFYGASAGKSWLTVVNRSSHTEFLDAGPVLNKIIAGLCGASGRNSFQETLRLTAPPLLAFMDSQLRAGDGDADAQQRVTDFYRFIDAEEAEDRVHFSIKPGTTRGTEEQPIAERQHPTGQHGPSDLVSAEPELAFSK